MDSLISSDTIRMLQNIDTPSICNAIETFECRLRNEGFINHEVKCLTPKLSPMVGYAQTIKVRAASPPQKKRYYLDQTDWWSDLLLVGNPRVLIVEDMDSIPGVGAFVGSVHAHILKALGCIGIITNGAVRDLHEISEINFNLFAGNVSPSHSYVHIVEHGTPVKIAGLEISPGDLIHGDQHGFTLIPPKIAAELPERVQQQKQREILIKKYCLSDRFSVNGLNRLISQTSGNSH
ncbi:MAG: RraA family protein [Verrucomicrobiota bacterium]